MEEQPASAAPPTPVPKQSPRPKIWHPSPYPVESMPLGGTTSKASLGGPPSSRWQEIPPWNRALKLNHKEAFGWDSDLVKEAREEEVGSRARMRGLWSITYGWCTTGCTWCATNVMIAHPQQPTLTPAMASRIVTNPESKILMSQFHLSNYQKKQNCLSLGSKQGGQDGMVYTRLPCWEYPYLPLQPWRRISR